MFTPTKLVCHQTICKSISLERPQYTENLICYLQLGIFDLLDTNYHFL